MAKKPKFYVVWEGRTPGIYTTWDEAQAQVNGHPEALYKAFATMAEAEEALDNGPLDYFANKVAQDDSPATKSQEAAKPTSTKDAPTTAAPKSSAPQARPTPPILPPDALREAIAVDAACKIFIIAECAALAGGIDGIPCPLRFTEKLHCLVGIGGKDGL